MQQENWDGFEGIETAERILGAALNCEATEVHISSDGDGATVFFGSKDRIEFFRHIPDRCRDALLHYLRDLTGVDQWCLPPVTGFGVLGMNDTTRSLELQIIKGSHGLDFVIKIGEA